MSFRLDDGVRAVGVKEYKAVALSLAEAFANDDVARYFIDTPGTTSWTPEQKWALHLTIMEAMVYAHCMRGLVTTAGDDYGCVALWMPPGTHMDDLWCAIRSGLWRLRFRLCTAGRERFFTEFMPKLHDTKIDILGERDERSWYLVYLGTRPAARGKGLAKKVVQQIFRKADEQGYPCYLESSSAVNVPIYRKMGFEVARTIDFHKGALPLDIMVREPSAVVERAVTQSGPATRGRATVSEKPMKIKLRLKKHAPVIASFQNEKAMAHGMSALTAVHAE